MNKTVFSFIVTFIAGLSTMIGVIPIYLNDKYKNTIIPISLAFSAGVMISISLFSLIPESIDLFITKFILFPSIIITLIFISIGVLISSFIDKEIEDKISNNSLYKLGVISIIVLVLHNIPEGITTFISTKVNTSLGLSLALGIALHNIPEGISIAVPIYYSTKSKYKAIIFTLISGFSELFGAILAYLFIAKYVNNFILGIILSITAGIMIHISIYELIPNTLRYKKRIISLLSFIIGFIIMIICIKLF
ncbi:MAG: ZIP family metal transporter [Bacilli bacterium]|nr:ZIP family metal transporter [Bacilli bacterium]